MIASTYFGIMIHEGMFMIFIAIVRFVTYPSAVGRNLSNI